MNRKQLSQIQKLMDLSKIRAFESIQENLASLNPKIDLPDFSVFSDSQINELNRNINISRQLIAKQVIANYSLANQINLDSLTKISEKLTKASNLNLFVDQVQLSSNSQIAKSLQQSILSRISQNLLDSIQSNQHDFGKGLSNEFSSILAKALNDPEYSEEGLYADIEEKLLEESPNFKSGRLSQTVILAYISESV